MNDGQAYVQFLMDIVGVDESFTPLCSKLQTIDFRYDRHIITDRNRWDDGLDLRVVFLKQHGYLAKTDSDAPSVLEVLVALSIRIDKDIMGEPGAQNPGRWFVLMLDNLGIKPRSDGVYNERLAEQVVNRWLSRTYEPSGKGSLFPLRKSKYDQRHISIWDQANEYLVENY